MSKAIFDYQRPQAAVLRKRVAEPRRFLQVFAGPRHAGKSTLVKQVTSGLKVPVRYVSADEPTLRGGDWIGQQWEAARLEIADKAGAVLVLDEIQKIPHWPETVKRLWDEDTRRKRPLKVMLLGSAPLLIARGLTESLAGRLETLRLPHWTYTKMREAFGWNLDKFLCFGGYPGAAPMIKDPARWARYIADSLIEPSISRDVLLVTRVDKPTLLRSTFELACRYSGQVLSDTKMLGQLQDAGDAARSRGSSPKLQVFNTALMNVVSGLSPQEVLGDREFRGRLIESAVRVHLANAAASGECELYYWRHVGKEVDFVVRAKSRVTAIEVKSGRAPQAHSGSQAFSKAFKTKRSLLVGNDGTSIEQFLQEPCTCS